MDKSKRKVLYYVIDAETGVQLKFGCKYKNVYDMIDPFNYDYKFVFNCRFLFFPFKLRRVYARSVYINGRHCYIMYVFPFGNFYKCKEFLYPAGFLLGLSGGFLCDKKDVLSNFVKFIEKSF